MTDTLKQLYVAYKEAQAKLEALERARTEGIAIIGMGCRFPGGANDPRAFWTLLAEGRDTVTDVPPDRWDRETWLDADADVPGKMYTTRGSYLDEVDAFDAAFFNISPREAKALDPQQRLLLEVCWEAFEHAGLDASRLKGTRTGVYVGISGDDYALAHRHSTRPETIDAYAITGTTPSTAAGRLSYAFDLRGPCLALDTACSSALVAVHLACRSLRAGESDLAVAGGVNLILTPDSHVCFSKLHAISPDGRCKAFDASANGYVRGEGCGLVILKRLSDAVADGDRVLAVVRGTAINQDGRSNGLTAPNGDAQRAVIHAALADAGMPAERIGYVEAHGTGTPLGDPIEIEAIHDALTVGRSADRPLLVGSVKTNVGHLEAAAGMAGLIKVVLALEHDAIPAHLHFREPSPHIRWSELPVRIPVEHTPWPRAAEPRVAGVSCFGFSGTNAHVIVEEAPVPAPRDPGPARAAHVLAISAKSEAALTELASRHARAVRQQAENDFAAICATAALGRSALECRLAVVAASAKEAADALDRYTESGRAPGLVTGDVREPRGRTVAFLYTGQGAQYPGMGRELYEIAPAFRDAVDNCDAVLVPRLGRSVVGLLCDDTLDPAVLAETRHAQPALFTLEYALDRLWRSWGLQPAAVLGHSVGEYVAACVAGVFSLDDGLRLVAERGRLMQALPTIGGMAVVFAGEADVAAAIRDHGERVAIASVNAPAVTVVSGERQALGAVLADLGRHGVKSRALAVSHAFHSPLMEPMVAAFERAARGVAYRAPDTTLVSNVTGDIAGPEIATPEYWARHILAPVRFADGVARLRERGLSAFVEVGPKPDLLAMARHTLPEDALLLASQRANRAVLPQMLESLAAVWVRGAAVDWSAVHGDSARHRVTLPTYPFQRQRYWSLTPAPARPADGAPPAAAIASPAATGPLDPWLDREFRSPLADTVYFETLLDAKDRPILRDHRVYGKVIVSGAMLVSIALRALARVLATPAIELRDVVFHQALQIPEGRTRLVHLAVTPGETGSVVKVASLDPDDPGDRGTLRVTGHAVAMAPGPDSIAHTDPDATWERLTATISGAEFYDRQRRRSIELGPLYRWIDTLRVGAGEAMGRLADPEGDAGVADPALGPALIDSCFALVLATVDAAMREDVTLVPVSVARFRVFRSPTGRRLRAHVRIGAASEQAVTGDIRLDDEAGVPIAEVIGLEGRRVDRRRLFREGGATRDDDLSTALYQVEWRAMPLAGAGAASTSAPLAAPADVAARVREAFRMRVARPETAAYARAMHRLDDVCVARVCRTLIDLGVDLRPGARVPTDESAERAGVIGSYRRLWRRLLEMLHDAGVLARDGDGWRARSLPAEVDAGRETHDHPEISAELDLVERCADVLGRVLTGTCDPLEEVLFPGGDLTRTAEIYRETHAARVMNEVLREAVEAVLSHVPAGRTVRILEVGAGTGGTTAAVLPALAALPAVTSYVFTDVSARFTSEARRTFAAHPFVRYERLDVERDPEAQGFHAHDFDIVIAANVLHATARLGEAVEHVRRLLAPGGVLMLLEGTAPVRWLDLTFGLTDGWWRFADDRVAYPLLSSEAWEALLQQHGFDQTLAVAAGPEEGHAVSQQALILARAGVVRTTEATRRRWLVFGDRGGGGRNVAARLERDASIECVTVSPAVSAGDECRQVGDRHWIVDAARPAAVAEMLDRISADAPLAGVVSTHALDVPSAEMLAEHSDDGPSSAAGMSTAAAPAWQGPLHLAQALVHRRAATAPRVWFVTRGAVSVAGEALPGLAQSPLWGLGATLAVEHPELATTLVDLDPDPNADVAAAIADEVLSGSAERRVALRGSTRYAARLARVDAGAVASAQGFGIRGDRTYLVTGGLGGLGTLVAGRFAEQGARHVALVGRHDPSSDARAAIEAMERAGSAVHVFRADVTDAGQVAAVLAQIDRDLPPLGGIVHAAGTLDNATLTVLDAPRFAQVLVPKVDGAWNVHRLTADRPLDFFLLFSSVASLLGAHGQANHAAASAFLDALAHDRRARGLPAQSVNWSAWADVGAAVRDGAMLRVKGVRPIAPARGLDVLEQVAALDRPAIAVLPVDWAAFIEQTGASPFLADVAPATPRDPAPTVSPLGALAGLSAADARARIARHVASHVAAVLGLPASATIHPRGGFFDMGMDSLTSVELSNRLQADLGCALPSTVAMDFPNVDALADHLAAQVLAVVPAAAPDTPAAAPATAADLDALARISDAEAEAMLLKALGEMKL